MLSFQTQLVNNLHCLSQKAYAFPIPDVQTLGAIDYFLKVNNLQLPPPNPVPILSGVNQQKTECADKSHEERFCIKSYTRRKLDVC